MTCNVSNSAVFFIGSVVYHSTLFYLVCTIYNYAYSFKRIILALNIVNKHVAQSHLLQTFHTNILNMAHVLKL